MPLEKIESSRRELEQLYCVTEQDFIDRDKRLCDCPMPMVRRKWNAALGRGVELRLCCMAKKVEEIAGLSEGDLFLALEFEPTWVWDCMEKQSIRKEDADGTVTETFQERGEPPRWLRERMEKKGLPILNSKEALNGQ